MSKKTINKELILILVCLFLCTCVVCISMIISKHLGQVKNKENSVNENIRYANVFYATIKNIKYKNDNTALVLIKGLEINDINDRGAFYFTIDKNTEISWRNVEINLSDLKVGQNVSITSIGDRLENSPALLTEVAKVIVLDDEL